MVQVPGCRVKGVECMVYGHYLDDIVQILLLEEASTAISQASEEAKVPTPEALHLKPYT